ncbi:MAG: LysM peptidoglycan-binding domain-containing protein [Candidatus Brachytrichaceae bacterium NZ_4S206]|jgi:LysM repeat protein
MIRLRALLMLASWLPLVACAAGPAETPTPDPVAMQTRIARELANIATAAPAPGRTPLASPTPAPARPPSTDAPLTPTATPSQSTLRAAGEYTVQPGDSLSSIAVKFGTSMAAIQLLNGLNDTRIVRAGQVLKLPADKLHPDENPWWFIYVIQPGETLSQVATKFRVPLADLLRVNEVANPGLVRAGQRLIIPAKGPRAN